MNLKWKTYNQTHYCYDDIEERIWAELYEDVLTGHTTAWMVPLEEPQKKYGTWLNKKAAKKAVELEIQFLESLKL